MNEKLKNRNQGLCELCNAENATIEYTVSPKSDDSVNNQVAICNTCLTAMDSNDASFQKGRPGKARHNR